MKYDPNHYIRNATESVKSVFDDLRRQEQAWLDLCRPPAVISVFEEIERQKSWLSNVIWPELGASQALKATVYDANKLSTEIMNRVTWPDRATQSVTSLLDDIKRQEQAWLDLCRPPAVMSVFADIERQQNWMKEMTKSLWPELSISQAMKAIISDVEASIASSMMPFHRLSEMIDGIKNFQVAINSDGSITASDAVFDKAEVESTVEACIQQSMAGSNQLSLELRINEFFSTLSKQHPVIRWVIVCILLPTLVGVNVNLMVQRYLSSPTKQSEIRAIKSVRYELKKAGVPKESLRKYRIVLAKTLNVRSHDTVKSELVGKLYFGQVVNVVQKKKNWALIEYEYEDGDSKISGWVFTRYIKNLS